MLKSDREKLEDYGNRLLAVSEPQLESDEAKGLLEKFTDDLAEVVVNQLQPYCAENPEDTA